MRAAISASARRALSTFTNGAPRSAGEAPSPMMAAAPAAAACAAKASPSALVPGHGHEHVAALDLAAVRGDAGDLNRAGVRIERGQSLRRSAKLHGLGEPRDIRNLQSDSG